MKFSNAEDFQNDLARVSTEKGWGYINRQGTWAIQPEYSFAGNCSDNICRIQARVFSGWSYISITGEKMFGGKEFEKAEDFSRGLARARRDSLWGYINTKGEFVITPKYENCLDFLPLN